MRAKCPFTTGWHEISVEGSTPEDVSYHVRLLWEAHMIDAEDLTTLSSPFPDWRPKTICWAGQEFLDSCRDNGRWEKAKRTLREKGVAFTMEAINIVLSDLLRRALTG